MAYYYNPLVKKQCSCELTFKKIDHLNYVDSNKYLRKRLNTASKQHHTQIPIMKSVLLSIGSHTHEFATTAGQKLMAATAGISLRGFQNALYALRKSGILVTRHRYSGEGPTKRRTTSVTVLTAFIEYVKWLSKIIHKPIPSKAKKNDLFSYETGEIIRVNSKGQFFSITTGEVYQL